MVRSVPRCGARGSRSSRARSPMAQTCVAATGSPAGRGSTGRGLAGGEKVPTSRRPTTNGEIIGSTCRHRRTKYPLASSTLCSGVTVRLQDHHRGLPDRPRHARAVHASAGGSGVRVDRLRSATASALSSHVTRFPDPYPRPAASERLHLPTLAGGSRHGIRSGCGRLSWSRPIARTA